MKRIRPLLVIVVFAVLVIGGVVWNISRIDECWDRGGTVVGPWTRVQYCVDQ